MKRRSEVAAVLALVLAMPAWAEPPRLLRDGPVAIDLVARLEWMRCSVGQVYIEETCRGEVLRMPFVAVPEAVRRVTASAGTGWRLPTRRELMSLVADTTTPPRIDTTVFPETLAEGYWTSDRPLLNPRHHWVVSFFTGHSYGRAFSDGLYAVRLVRDRLN